RPAAPPAPARGRRGDDLHAAVDGGRAAVVRLRRAARALPGRHDEPQGPRRRAVAGAARRARARAAYRRHHRRGAEPQYGSARGAAPADEHRDDARQAAAGHPDRAARAGEPDGAARAAPAGAADHGAVPPAAVQLHGDARLRASSPAGSRTARDDLHLARSERDPPPLRRRGAGDQQRLRSRAAWRLRAPQRPSPARLLDGTTVDRDAALASLFARWGVEFQPRPGENACEIARRSGLRCLVRTGTWNVIRRLDVPAMLTLMTPTGERHYATVTALGADTVTLDLAPRPVTLLLNDVERFWDGAFVALWRTPDLAATLLKPGDDLRQRVVAFQRANGLRADGVVGEETLLRLAATTPGSRPSLSRATP